MTRFSEYHGVWFNIPRSSDNNALTTWQHLLQKPKKQKQSAGVSDNSRSTVTQQYVETITAQTYKQQQNQTVGAVTTWTTKQSDSDNMDNKAVR